MNYNLHHHPSNTVHDKLFNAYEQDVMQNLAF